MNQLTAEALSALPDLMEVFERDAPGMYQTKTVDYAIVLSGELPADRKPVILRPAP